MTLSEFVFINYHDNAYAKVLLDEKSLKYVLQNIEKIDSLLLSQLLWATLKHMLVDGKLPGKIEASYFLINKASEFIRMVRSKVQFIKSHSLVETVLSYVVPLSIGSGRPVALNFLSKEKLPVACAYFHFM